MRDQDANSGDVQEDNKIWNARVYFTRMDRGATAVEYGMMVAFIAAICVGTVSILGGNVLGLFNLLVGKF